MNPTAWQELARDYLAERYGEAVVDDFDGTLKNAVRITAFTDEVERARWIVLPSGRVRAAWDPDNALSTYRPSNRSRNYAVSLGAGDMA